MGISQRQRFEPLDEEDGMKKTLWQVVGFLAALLAVSYAVGQTERGDTMADIPFAFTVSNHTLPAGRYIVTRPSQKFLRIFNSQNQGTFALTNRVEGKAAQSGKMVFHRYGNAYFLSEVWVSGSRTGRKVVQSRSEKELAGRRTKMEIAELQIAR
jgi:hypothetical protein